MPIGLQRRHLFVLEPDQRDCLIPVRKMPGVLKENAAAIPIAKPGIGVRFFRPVARAAGAKALADRAFRQGKPGLNPRRLGALGKGLSH
jgi:hypothetical protein